MKKFTKISKATKGVDKSQLKGRYETPLSSSKDDKKGLSLKGKGRCRPRKPNPTLEAPFEVQKSV